VTYAWPSEAIIFISRYSQRERIEKRFNDAINLRYQNENNVSYLTRLSKLQKFSEEDNHESRESL